MRKLSFVVVFGKLLRFVLGGFFIGTGVYYWADGGWAAVVFGALFVGSGFFRARRCGGADGCRVN